MKIRLQQRGDDAKIVYILVFCILILIFIISLALAKYDIKKVPELIFDPDAVQIISSLGASISVGILSSWIFSRMQQKKREDTVEKIIRAGYEDASENIINQIASYAGVFMPSYRVSMRFKLSGCKRFLIVSQTYEYTKTLAAGGQFRFRFRRATSHEQAKQIDHSPELLHDNYKSHEFFFTNNDSDLIARGVPTEELEATYSIKDLTINARECVLRQSKQEKYLYEADFMLDPQDGKPSRISYTVTFPLDLQDYLFVVIEYPAKEVTFELDYSAVQGLIDVDHINYLGNLRGFPGSMSDNDAKITVRHSDGWLLPKCGVVFVWYKNSADEK